MNKRLVKKMKKKRLSFHGVVCAYGNKGGDILEIYDNCDGTVHLHSGHCCVTTIDHCVPVEFITGLFEGVMMEYHFDLHAIINSFKWDDEFKNTLKAKIH